MKAEDFATHELESNYMAASSISEHLSQGLHENCTILIHRVGIRQIIQSQIETLQERYLLKDGRKIWTNQDINTNSLEVTESVGSVNKLPGPYFVVCQWTTKRNEDASDLPLSLPESRINSRAREHLELPISLCVADVEIKPNLQSFVDAKARDDSGHWWGVNLASIAETTAVITTSSYLVRDSQMIIVRRNEIHLPLLNFPDAFETLASLINPPLKTNHHNCVIQYSRQYRLASTLLNEDASAGSSVSNWDVRAGLVFQNSPKTDRSYGVTPEDLTVFINSAEWSLSLSVSNDPVLHFVLFIPSALRRPLHISSPDGQISRSRSFLLPQWGGIVIYSPPTDDTGQNTNLPSETNEQIFKEFSEELFSLLGMLPNGVKRHISEAASLSDWQFDALMRRHTAENVKNTQETLTSIVKPVDQIGNMPVKEDVRDDVQGALEALEQEHVRVKKVIDKVVIVVDSSLSGWNQYHSS
ncbi:hypothetical protein AGABI2DRAFT_178717 [Agaricus bisporus var. bisporus H97]|uniref:hypothetical protein n=1 Tax=Agaricus bisporus var. bisporus (strain H97 / ATCC MYA-4626 / FGSC 10389) TaxID=936046 RepID=UPI00029F7F35|nr:hypothetical protein AGABI2DRAFT_178717 [Agaricus bisporus var. bisporus H97]EKV46327.1 hypothetical protein AGABI2DRAFT_178717 [Agaricus bisporus var. bisporus H97]